MATFIRVKTTDHDDAYKTLNKAGIDFYCHQVAFEIMNEGQMDSVIEIFEIEDIEIIVNCSYYVTQEVDFIFRGGAQQHGRIKDIEDYMLIVAYENVEDPSGPYLRAVVNALNLKML